MSGRHSARKARCRVQGCRVRPQLQRLIGIETPVGRACVRVCDRHFGDWIAGRPLAWKPFGPPAGEEVEIEITEVADQARGALGYIPDALKSPEYKSFTTLRPRS